MRTIILLIFVLFLQNIAFSQSENRDLREGNRLFREGQYQEAELHYRKALEQNSQNNKAMFNLSNALYRQGRYEEAAELFEGLSFADMSDKDKADVWHNLGNSQVNAQNIAEGIESYKNALRLRPEDMDSRHNLAYARRLLQEQEQQQEQEQDQDPQEDQEDGDEQEQQPDSGDDEQDQEDQQQQPRPDQISPEDAERILDALNQQEQKVQENIEREERERRPVQIEREW